MPLCSFLDDYVEVSRTRLQRKTHKATRRGRNLVGNSSYLRTLLELGSLERARFIRIRFHVKIAFQSPVLKN